MADIATNIEIRRKITEACQDMRRANQRATDAATALHRATSLFESPARIDWDAVEAALADLRDARTQYLEAHKRQQELKNLLGE